MNLARKIAKILLCILLIAICALSVIQKAFLMPIHNVFDEMYYSASSSIIDNHFIPWGRWFTGCNYGNVGVYAPRGGSLDMTMTDIWDAERGVFYRRYRAGELEEKEQLLIYVCFEEKLFTCSFTIDGGEIPTPEEGKYPDDYPPSITWSCEYSIDEKTMYIDGPNLNYTVGEDRLQTKDEEQIAAFFQEQGLTKTAEEYEHYFLYDKIIRDWTMGNLFRSKYATWWIGNVKFADGPPPEKTA